jgi:raffinose/stachyose/melibiose transport system substrate-binding protein
MTSMRQHDTRRRRSTLVAVSGAITAFALTACGAPGGSGPETTGIPVSTEIGPDEVTLSVRVNADQEAMWAALVDGFEADYPSVTVDLQTEAFDTLQQNAPRYLAANDAPDLLRLAAPGDAVVDGLLLDLDPYAAAWGWDEFPSSQLEQWTIDENGRTKGSGTLYALGAGFGLVGMYVDETKLAALGFDEAPATLDEFEDVLAAAHDAGQVGVLGDVTYLFQGLMQSLGATDTVRDWVNNAEGADLDVPAAVEAAEILTSWSEQGYLAADASTTDAGTAFGRFLQGEGVFFAHGSWFAGGVDQAAGPYGFTILPPRDADEPIATMSASNAMVIPAGAEHPNEAAAFLDWIQRDAGRQVIVEVGGLAPGGLGDLDTGALADRPVFAATLEAFARVSADDGIVDFLGNATASMTSSTLVPQSQLLLGGKISAAEFVSTLQADYEASQR